VMGRPATTTARPPEADLERRRKIAHRQDLEYRVRATWAENESKGSRTEWAEVTRHREAVAGLMRGDDLLALVLAREALVDAYRAIFGELS
jgi:hypothetical protein